MLERISKLLTIKELSASKFADEIGVQRSSISHILSGRNKPSLEFVLKILERYPDISPDWLLKGKGKIFREDTDLFTGISDKKIEKPPQSEPEPTAEAKTNKNSDEPAWRESEKTPTPDANGSQADKSEIEKIIIFYRNKKFRVYFPDH